MANNTTKAGAGVQTLWRIRARRRDVHYHGRVRRLR